MWKWSRAQRSLTGYSCESTKPNRRPPLQGSCTQLFSFLFFSFSSFFSYETSPDTAPFFFPSFFSICGWTCVSRHQSAAAPAGLKYELRGDVCTRRPCRKLRGGSSVVSAPSMKFLLLLLLPPPSRPLPPSWILTLTWLLSSDQRRNPSFYLPSNFPLPSRSYPANIKLRYAETL